MAVRRLTILRLVIASPSDVEAEWKVVAKVVADLNHGLAQERGFRIDIATWRTDAFPGFHPEGPQGHIDENLKIEDSDILLAIFWTHFGTPVADAESGTQHEILRAIRTWKTLGKPQVMVYFKTAPYSPSDKYENEQWAKVLAFRDNFPEKGLWASFKTKPQFDDLLRLHLTNFIRNHKPKKRRSSSAGRPVAESLANEIATSVALPTERQSLDSQNPATEDSSQSEPNARDEAVRQPEQHSSSTTNYSSVAHVNESSVALPTERQAFDPTSPELTHSLKPNQTARGEVEGLRQAEPQPRVSILTQATSENRLVEAMFRGTTWQIGCRRCQQKSKWVRLRGDGLVEFRYGNDTDFRLEGDDTWRVESDQLIISWCSGYSIDTFTFIKPTQTTAPGAKSNVRGPLRITRL